ncbi:hypothetical protein [Microbulbifer sp. JMSA003]|uniref:hypothetical protein n=1 Tax=Microbulbifer sp. JMSA003 TaxID=3243369 RepID=UPI00403A059C
MEFELLDPSTSWSKFNFMLWLSLAAFLVVYLGVRLDAIRKSKTVSLGFTLLFSSSLPAALIYMGYSNHLDSFYSVKLGPANFVELAYVYPEGKRVVLSNVSGIVKPQRGNGCTLVLRSGGELFESVMASSRGVCSAIKHALSTNT